MDTLDHILKKYILNWEGCVCGHFSCVHVKEVKNCGLCNCGRYKPRVPVDIPNMGRDQLPALFTELGFKTGAEIGVYKGEYSEVLCKGIPDLTLYCVDPYRVYPGYPMTDQAQMDRNFVEARKRLEVYAVTFLIQPSMEATYYVPDGSLDFVYIDGNHEFVHVINDLHAWIPKVRKGGIVAGHDYIQRGMGPTVFGKHNRTFHVKEAVEAYTDAYKIDPWFAIGRREPREGEIRDKIRSFMWINV